MDEADQLIFGIEAELTQEPGVVTVCAGYPFGAEAQRVRRVQNVHGRCSRRESLLDRRDFVSGDNLRHGGDGDRGAERFAALLVDIGGRRTRLAAEERIDEKLTELFAGIPADHIE